LGKILQKGRLINLPTVLIAPVHYDISVNRDGKIIKQIRENHVMRFMFVQEMAILMQSAGLKLIHSCPFLEPDGQLSTDTWNATFVAQKEP